MSLSVVAVIAPAVTQPLLSVQDLGVAYGVRTALAGVTFELFAGETLGLVGESGSGKSTLARAVLRLVRVNHGRILWKGEDLLGLDARALRAARRDLGIVFQDPLASLDPRMPIGESIAEPLRIFEPTLSTAARSAEVSTILERVGLSATAMHRYPHEFSGGQCQRIGIARAMILRPRLLLCDEPVSSLDVSIQGQIVNLLLDLQRDFGTALLFISHNLAVVRHISSRVLVMYAGRLIESARREELFNRPLHPYTRALLEAVPSLAPPRPLEMPPEPPTSLAQASGSGCAYRSRCPFVLPVCESTVPPLETLAAHEVACHRAREFV